MFSDIKFLLTAPTATRRERWSILALAAAGPFVLGAVLWSVLWLVGLPLGPSPQPYWEGVVAAAAGQCVTWHVLAMFRKS